jgi:hypothetical protein
VHFAEEAKFGVMTDATPLNRFKQTENMATPMIDSNLTGALNLIHVILFTRVI